jgi:hypothetical protein
MAAELFDHVIEKPDAGRHLIGAGAIEIDGNRDPGFGGVALYRASACGDSDHVRRYSPLGPHDKHQATSPALLDGCRWLLPAKPAA